MSVKLKLQLSKKSLAKLSLILLVSYSLFLVKANSQSDGASNYFGYSLLIFSVVVVVVIVLTILVIIKNPVTDFLLKNYKMVIIALIILFILIYFIPQVPFKSITGLFVTKPTTTTTTTTTPEMEEAALPELVKTFSKLKPAGVNVMEIFGEGVSLTELDLEVYSELNNVKITVSKLDSKPAATQNPPGNVYQYLRIEKTNIKNEDLKKVNIKFRVEKPWINENEIDESTISLNRYQDNVWVGLSTAKTGEDDQFSYYETYTASLSLYSITGSSEPLGETTTTTTVVTTTTLTSTTLSETQPLQTTTQTETSTYSTPVSSEAVLGHDQDNSIYIVYGGTPSGDPSNLNVLGDGLTYDIPEGEIYSYQLTKDQEQSSTNQVFNIYGLRQENFWE